MINDRFVMENQKINKRNAGRKLSGWMKRSSLLFLLGWFLSTAAFSQTPKPADPNAGKAPAAPAAAGDATAGKALFQKHCSRCHSPKLENDMTGPALMGVTGRVPSKEWLYKWIPNSAKLIESGDKYAVELKNKWKSNMDPMPVSAKDIDDILAFIDGYSPISGDPTKTDTTPMGDDVTVGKKWNWINFLIFIVVMLLGIIAVQVARLRNVDFFEGVNMDKLNGRLLLGFFIFGMVGAVYCTGLFKDFYLLTNPASKHGADIDFMFWMSMVVVAFVFIVCNAFLFYFSFRYAADGVRKARFYPENHKLELIWTVVPAIVLTGLVIFGVKIWTKVTAPLENKAGMAHLWEPNVKTASLGENAIVNIEVSGQQFGWVIRYPGFDEKFGEIDLHLISGSNDLGVRLDQDSSQDDFISDSLVLPKGVTVDLKIRSRDVLHSVYLPHFRVKMDAVPGMDTRFHFVPTQSTADFRKWLSEKAYYNEIDPKTEEDSIPKKRFETFDYELACAEVCGKGHFSMRKTVVVMEIPDFIKWYRSAAARKNIVKNAAPAPATTDAPGSTDNAIPAPVNH
jgi:cytochrome c oxidase subunit II